MGFQQKLKAEGKLQMRAVVAFFSGQGAQSPGMGKELWEQSSAAKKVYETGRQVLGYDLAALSFFGPKEELDRTLYAQPAIFALSVAAWEASKETVFSSDNTVAVAGHSLGEYAALYAAGAYSLEDGFRILQARAKAMEKAGQHANGSMCAILRSSEEVVEQACGEAREHTGGFVEPVNFNTSGQTVISGEKETVAFAVKQLEAQGARAVPLAVSSAFHTPLMECAAKEFRKEIQPLSFKKTNLPFYSNVTGERVEIEDYPAYFAQHMTHPVYFRHQMEALVADGYRRGIEFGPGKTVINLAKRNQKGFGGYSVETYGDVVGLPEFLAGE